MLFKCFFLFLTFYVLSYKLPLNLLATYFFERTYILNKYTEKRERDTRDEETEKKKKWESEEASGREETSID